MNIYTRFSLAKLIAICLATLTFFSLAEDINDGTDPTKLANTAFGQYKHTDLGVLGNVGLFEFSYGMPIDQNQRMNVTAKLPVASGVINNDFSIGDVSLTFTHIASLNQKRGLAYSTELIFDTADRAELGLGNSVLKLSAFYVKFLESGGIFAPAIVQQNNISNSTNRASVNNTTIDLYYVPKLKNPGYFITFDPSITADWENDKNFLSLSVTFGRILGKAFGGNSQIFVKPQILGGSERPADWSLQIGYKVIGF